MKTLTWTERGYVLLYGVTLAGLIAILAMAL
jgi:hypothetical protein